MGRAPCCDKSNVKRGPWSHEEDARLRDYIEEHGIGGNWIALPQNFGIKRCGKSCRLRWLNYLRPNIKHGGFSEEEDSTICNLYISIGSRWSIIAAQLPGRTDNDIKNYWNTKLKKRLLGINKRPSEYNHLTSNKPDDNSANEKNTQVLNTSALERMQLHMQLQGLHGLFSFYNSPLLWPKINNLASTTPVQQQSNTTLTKPIREPILTTELQSPNCITGNMQKQFNYSTPCLNRSNLDIDSLAAERLQEELHDLLYSENGYFSGWDDERQIDSHEKFDCEPRRTNGNWSFNNCFDDKSNPESWESLIL